MPKKNNSKNYQYALPEKNVPKRTYKQSERQQKGGFKFQNDITNEIKVREELHSFSILDNEWNSIRNKVIYLREETKKANFGQYLDGFGITVLLPFFQSLYNILMSSGVPLESDKNSCWFYGTLFIIYFILKIIGKLTKCRLISSYSDLKKDIEILDERMIEIETNLGIKETKK